MPEVLSLIILFHWELNLIFLFRTVLSVFLIFLGFTAILLSLQNYQVYIRFDWILMVEVLVKFTDYFEILLCYQLIQLVVIMVQRKTIFIPLSDCTDHFFHFLRSIGHFPAQRLARAKADGHPIVAKM